MQISPFVAASPLGLLGLLIHLTPVDTAVLYGIPLEKTSPLLYSLLSFMGASILVTAVYVVALAFGCSRARALSALHLTNALFSTKFALVDAVTLGAPRERMLVGSVVSVGLAAVALR